MQDKFLRRISILMIFAVFLVLGSSSIIVAQSRPQRPPAKGTEKKNQRPTPKTPEEIQKEEEEKRLQEEIKNAEVDEGVIDIKTNIVNINTVVYNKKTGQIITGLKQENFGIFEDGKKQEITNFSMPDSPITVSLVVEYSKWSEIFGRASGGYFDDGHLEVIRPVSYFLSQFIKAPDDYASVIAFDMRPTPITDFTNDPGRLRQTVDLLLRNRPAFRENNLFDAINFSLIGGRADSVVLEDSKESKTEYGGMVDVDARRRAIILVASGIDTFSRINYSEVRKTIRKAGVPIYIISTGNLFFKKYEHLLGPTDSLTGMPGRLTFLQARNAMNTFAKESGGQHFEMTFPGEIPNILQSINGLLRNQYSIAYDAGEGRKADKKYKLEVKVDVNGDGVYDEKNFVVQHRPYYSTELSKEEKKDDK